MRLHRNRNGFWILSWLSALNCFNVYLIWTANYADFIRGRIFLPFAGIQCSYEKCHQNVYIFVQIWAFLFSFQFMAFKNLNSKSLIIIFLAMSMKIIDKDLLGAFLI